MTPIVPSFRRDGTFMDLANVRATDIDFHDIANALSKIARFNGSYSGGIYSVAQHSVIGADAIFAQTKSKLHAGYFLLHDAHEALIGDWTRPAVDLLDYWIQQINPPTADRTLIHSAVRLAKKHIDLAIYAAAGISFSEVQPFVHGVTHVMDQRMLIAETIALFGRDAAARLEVPVPPAPELTESIARSIKTCRAIDAEYAFLRRLKDFLLGDQIFLREINR